MQLAELLHKDITEIMQMPTAVYSLWWAYYELRDERRKEG